MITIPKSHRDLADQVAEDVADYLAAGGKIYQAAHGETRAPEAGKYLRTYKEPLQDEEDMT